MIPARLSRSADVRAVLAARGKRAGRHLDAYILDHKDERSPRLAVVAGKRVGSAVERNRAKRRIRAAVARAGMPPGRDAVIVARASAVGADFGSLEADVRLVTTGVGVGT